MNVREATPPRRRAAPRRPAGARRSPAAVAVSVALHGALAVAMAHALRVPAPFLAFFARDRAVAVPERVAFVEARAPLPPSPEPVRGDGRPTAAPPPVAAPSPVAPDEPPAPSEAPSEAPTAPTSEGAPEERSPEAGRGTGTGGGAGGPGGALAGLRPTYTGPSAIWARPGWVHGSPATVADRLDSLVAVELLGVRDSLLRESQRRRPGDWTFERDGRKYGMDQSFIHLGRVSVPTALLGLVPIRQQANPIARERQRHQDALGAESRAQARRRQDDADVKARISAIRERKERERAERRAGAASSGARTSAPPG